MENSHNNSNSKNTPIFNNGQQQENRVNDAASEEIDRVEDCSDDEDNKNHYANQGPPDGHPLYKTPNLLSIPEETQENQNYTKLPYAPTFSYNNNANTINSKNVSTFFSNDNDYTNNMVHPFQHSDVVRQNRNVCGTDCPIGPETSLQGPNCNWGLQNNPNAKNPTGFPTFSPSPINQWQFPPTTTPNTVVDYGFSVHDKNRYKGGNRQVPYSSGNNSPNPFNYNDARSPRNRSGCRSPAAAPAEPFNADIYRSNNESLQNFSQSCPASPCDCDCGPCDSPTQTYNDCINDDTCPCPCTCPCENCNQGNICAGNCDCNCCRQDCYSSPCDCCNTCCNNDCCCSPFSSCCPPSCFPYGCGIDPWNPCCYSSGSGQFCCPGQCCGCYPSCYPPSCHTTCIQPSPYCSPVRISVGTGACPCDCQCPFPCGCPCPCPCPCDCNKPPCCCPDTPPPPEGWYISGYKLYNVEPRILGYKCTYEIRKKRTIIKRNMCGGIISIEDGDCPAGSKSKSCTNLLAASKSRSNSQESQSQGSNAGEDGDAE